MLEAPLLANITFTEGWQTHFVTVFKIKGCCHVWTWVAWYYCGGGYREACFKVSCGRNLLLELTLDVSDSLLQDPADIDVSALPDSNRTDFSILWK